MSVGGASPIDSSSAREEAGSKETPFVAEPCPFPECRVGCGRPQELESHIWHLPRITVDGGPQYARTLMGSSYRCTLTTPVIMSPSSLLLVKHEACMRPEAGGFFRTG